MGGDKREGKFFKGNNGGERIKELIWPKVEEGLFIAQGQIKPLGKKTKSTCRKNG